MEGSSRFIRLNDVMGKVGLSRSQVYRLIQEGLFPSPIKIGKRISVWLESHVEAWMMSVQEQSRQAK